MKQNISDETALSAPEPVKKSSLKKRLLWIGGILLVLILLLTLIPSFLLLGKVRHYPQPALDFTHFRILNKVMRKYAKARKAGKRKGVLLRKITLKFNEQETDALIAIGETYAKKQNTPLKWKADFLEEGKLEIRFSRHLGSGIALNGRLVLTPAYKDGILALKVHIFELGRLSLDPGWIQGDLDKALMEARKRKEYALLRDNIESIRIENGKVYVTLKTRDLRKLPGNIMH